MYMAMFSSKNASTAWRELAREVPSDEGMVYEVTFVHHKNNDFHTPPVFKRMWHDGKWFIYTHLGKCDQWLITFNRIKTEPTIAEWRNFVYANPQQSEVQ